MNEDPLRTRPKTGKTRASITAGAVFLVLASGLLYASPYLLVSHLRSAAQNGDASTVSSHVDFDALRASVKDQVDAKIGARIQNDSLLAQVGAQIANALVARTVDALVTPEALANLLRGQRPKSSVLRSSSDPNAPVQMHMGYDSFSSFALTFSTQNSADALSVLFSRDGLSWKITGVKIPF